MKNIVFFILLLTSSVIVHSANDNVTSDAISLSLGGASVVLDNVYANFNNQALLAFVESPTLATCYYNTFSISSVQVMAAIPISTGTIGVNVSRYGSSLYSEYKAAASFSRRFGDNFAASLQADLLSVLPSPNEQSINAFTAEIGLWARPMEDLTLGFHLYNFINAQYKGLYYDENVPVIMKLGMGYSIFENFQLTVEIENSSIHGTSVRGGMEYYIVDQVVLRTGGASNPSLASIGLGVILGKLHIDIATQAVRYIGKTGGVSMSYTF